MYEGLDHLVEAGALLESRGGRWLFAIGLTLAIGVEVAVIVSGYWPNVGSAPIGTGCRYWTGLKLVYRPTFNPTRCPLYIERIAQDV